jgi:hypothetical protein
VARALPLVFAVLVGLVLLWSLIGAFVVGPVVVRTMPVHIETRASPERLRRDVARLCGELGPRDSGSPERLARVASWIASELHEAGFETTAIEPYSTSRGVFHNVVARRAGLDPARGVRLVGAHYDAIEGTPGADDNASGVAVLLELARALGRRGPARQAQWLAAFATEEPPFFGTDEMGSHALASDIVARGITLELMVALDLVGVYSDEPHSQRVPSPLLRPLYPSRGNFIAVVGDARSGRAIEEVKRSMKSTGALPVHSFRAPAGLQPAVMFSDHLSFRRLGLPAVLVTDTAFMRYAHYHTPADTPERLDYERMAALVVALIAVLEA